MVRATQCTVKPSQASTEKGKPTTPQRRDDRATPRDEHALVDAVGRACVRGASKDCDRSPAERLGCDGAHVLELRQVVERWQSVRAHDTVQFGLREGHEGAAKLGAGEEEGGE